MTTLTINIENKKAEREIKAYLSSKGITYDEKPAVEKTDDRPLNKAEQKLFDGLKSSFEYIRLHQEGKIELKDARDFLNELQG